MPFSLHSANPPDVGYHHARSRHLYQQRRKETPPRLLCKCASITLSTLPQTSCSSASGTTSPAPRSILYGTFKAFPSPSVAKRTWKSFLADNLLGRAAELGFYFLFALFPTLFSASSAPRPRRPLSLHHLCRSSPLPRPRHSHLCPRHRPRNLQRDHSRSLLRQTHLRPHRLHLVRLRRHLRNSGCPQHRLQGQRNPLLLHGTPVRHRRHHHPLRHHHPHPRLPARRRLLRPPRPPLHRKSLLRRARRRSSPASSAGSSHRAFITLSFAVIYYFAPNVKATLLAMAHARGEPSASSSGSLASLVLRAYTSTSSTSSPSPTAPSEPSSSFSCGSTSPASCSCSEPRSTAKSKPPPPKNASLPQTRTQRTRP